MKIYQAIIILVLLAIMFSVIAGFVLAYLISVLLLVFHLSEPGIINKGDELLYDQNDF